MKYNRLTLSVLILCAMVCPSCSHHHDHDHDHEAHHEAESEPHIHSANGVDFHDEMKWGIDFATAPVTMQPLGNVIHTMAQVLPAQGDEIILTAQVEGVVRGLDGSCSEGAEVKAGQVLCQIDASVSAGDNLRAQQQQSQAELDRAKFELARLESLRADQLVLESEVQSARASFQQAQATWDALHRGYGNGQQSVTAPRAGYLAQWLVTAGQHVEEGTQIAVLTQGQRLQLRAEVPARYRSDLSKVAGAILCPTGGEPVSLDQLEGRLLGYGRQTSLQSPLLPVTFEVKASDGLVAGTFVEMYIKTRSSDDRMCIPSTSLLEEQGNYFVYVQLAPEYYEKRQVFPGVTDGLLTEIRSGVQVGDTVVSRGAIMLKLQQSAGAVDPHSGHSH